MMPKSKIRHAFKVAGVASFLLFTSGCCNGRFSFVRNHRTHCTCSNPQTAKTQVAQNDDAIDTHSRYFTESGYQKNLTSSDIPLVANSILISRQKTLRNETEPQKISAECTSTPAPINSVVVSEKSAGDSPNSNLVIPPQEIQADPIEEGVASEQAPDSQAEGNLLVNDVRSYGENEDGWKLPDADQGKTFELPAPTTDSTEPALDDSVPGSIVGEVNKNIVLRAKVVQPLIRPLPDDARFTQGRRLNPAKPVGYTRDELEQVAPEIQSPAHQIEELQPLRRPKPLIDPVSVEKKEKTAGSPSKSPGKTVLKAIPKSTEINFLNLPQPAAPLIPNQAAAPVVPTRNR